jgi:1-acyl-sn-glycerol-3-phosphate acyltransferase
MFMKWMSASIFGLLRLGGASVRRVGTLPTASPILVVANHQALLDICQITLMAHPRVPGFVTRRTEAPPRRRRPKMLALIHFMNALTSRKR